MIIKEDGSILSVSSARRITWSHVDNSTMNLMAAKYQTITDHKGFRVHPDRESELSVLFEITDDDQLIRVGPIKTDQFPKLTHQNLTDRLLMDARKFKMTWTRCEDVGS